MPLHDWSDRGGWEGMHHLWITELLRWVKPRLPVGYRAYIGSAPLLAVGAPSERPDVSVRAWPDLAPNGSDEMPTDYASDASLAEPDVEVGVATLDPGTALFVASQGRLVAAVELVSPRNKDRLVARTAYLARYLGYLLEGAHLVLIDVHRRPLNFSFADYIADELQLKQPPSPPPIAVSYRVGEPAPDGGRFLAIWRRPLSIGQALPTLPLPLTLNLAVPLDLEHTYSRAAIDAYLEP